MKKSREPLGYELENLYGELTVAGVDEAGRGPLCGPVCAAAVILPRNLIIEGLDDSKKLSGKKREELFEKITSVALAYSVAFASEREIDEKNILNATMLAMTRALEGLKIKPEIALIDGNISRGIPFECKTVIGGDAKSPSIAAASVLAKVSRDRLCIELDAKYPQYKIAKHKGYPTAEHIALVKKYGANGIYRRSFLTKILDEK